MRRLFLIFACLLTTSAAASAQQQQTERFSFKLGSNGRVSVSNISGEIVVTSGPGDDVTIEATKRTPGDRSELASVRIVVSNGPGRVDVRTEHNGRTDHVSVDYKVVVPGSATLDLHSVSGGVQVSKVQGPVRAESVSGSVSLTDVSHVDLAKSVSGTVTVSGVSEGDLNIGSVSGNVIGTNIKARSLSVSTVSGAVRLTDAICERLTAKSVSGDIEYDGTLVQNGRYDINTHSGRVRLRLPATVGFELDADTFSGSIRSEFAMTVGGDANQDIRRRGRTSRSMRATFGDGKAALILHTFSGDVVLTKR